MEFTIYTASCQGQEANCHYPVQRHITDTSQMEEAVRFDHVCVDFKNQYRLKENFRSSNVIVMDCDNTHSETESDWVSIEQMVNLLPDVAMVIVTSRNHMKDKEGSIARPRFHLYFPIPDIASEAMYTEAKHAIFDRFSFLDDAALDAARFIYGVDEALVYWQEGGQNILECIANEAKKARSIPQGKRNSTMSRFAGRVIKRYGASEKAYQIFFDEAEKCDPPLADEELNRIWESAVRFGQRISKQDGYISPEEYNQEFGTGASLKPDDFSDIGQAKVLAREYGNELRYTDGTDFIRYNGIYWEESRQAAVGAAEEFLDLQLADAIDSLTVAREELVQTGLSDAIVVKGGKTLEKLIDEGQRELHVKYVMAEAYKSFVMKRRDMRYVLSALQALKPMVHMKISELDRDEFLLNTPSATYDLRHGLAGGRGHKAEDFITKCTLTDPGNEGSAVWEQALDTFFCGDKELILYAKHICGLMAIGKVYVEALVIAYGEGRNGKSTFWNAIARVMGTYCGGISADALTAGCKRNVRPEMAELKGKRLVIAAEMEEGMRLSTSVLKQLCSTDEVSGEKKYKDPFKFTPTHTLVLYTNHLPKVGASDEGTWRRLIVIPFNARLEGAHDVKNYTDYLVTHAGPSILAWIIDGARQIIERGFHLSTPACVTAAIQKYRTQNDWLGHFLEECCEVASSYQARSGELYSTYRAFCHQTNEYVRSTSDFYAALENNGFSRRKQRAGYFINGLRLKVMDFLE